jgi:hypothetical protein
MAQNAEEEGQGMEQWNLDRKLNAEQAADVVAMLQLVWTRLYTGLVLS